MAITLGTFAKLDDGSFSGILKTLNVTASLTIVPVTKRPDNAPDHRVFAGNKLALIERSRDFTLVRWRPVLDRHIGQQVSGTVVGDGVTWNFGRTRSGPTIT